MPYNDTSRPIIVSQEYLIHFDDFLLPCNVPTIIAKPLTVIKHLVSTPHTDKEKTYYTALSKQPYQYSELLFISAKVIAFMVKAEKAKSETQYTTPKQYTPKPPDKLNNVLTSRILRDLTSKLDPHKNNSTDSPLRTLTHILECYDHTLKILQSLDIDSQRITQSSKAIQTTLEILNIVFSHPIKRLSGISHFLFRMVHFEPYTDKIFFENLFETLLYSLAPLILTFYDTIFLISNLLTIGPLILPKFQIFLLSNILNCRYKLYLQYQTKLSLTL